MSSRIAALIALSACGSIFLLKRKKPEKAEEANSDFDHLLCKFAVDGSGRKIGESVAINKDIMIIKSGSRFLGVPLKHIEDGETSILVKGLIDFSKAYELGDTWRQESQKLLDENEEG